VSFGVLSISQPEKTEAQRETPCFLGFFAGFLEITFGTSESHVY
jgi:hypothetical protein